MAKIRIFNVFVVLLSLPIKRTKTVKIRIFDNFENPTFKNRTAQQNFSIFEKPAQAMGEMPTLEVDRGNLSGYGNSVETATFIGESDHLVPFPGGSSNAVVLPRPCTC